MADGKRAVDSDKVWTALITNTAYLSGLLTLDFSLKRSGSAYPLVALYTDTFPALGLAALRSRGVPHQRIEYLLPTSGGRDYSADPRFYDCWSKLTPFSLTQYGRVVQLDADMLVLRNMDELMHLPLDDGDWAAEHTTTTTTTTATAAAAGGGGEGGGGGEEEEGGKATDGDAGKAGDEAYLRNPSRRVFAAGHACVCNPLRKAHYPVDWVPANCAFTSQHATPSLAQHSAPDPLTSTPLGFMNGGLQVVNPSRALFGHVVAYMETFGADLEFADQSVLTGLFRGRWVALPYVYNALKTLRWEGVHREIWRDDEVKNVHYILAPKPWDEQEGEVSEESHAWWWKVNGERKAWEKENGVADDGF